MERLYELHLMRMKVTLELLERYGGISDLDRDFLESRGLIGATPLEIMDAEFVNIDFLHFLRQYFEFTEEECQRYFEICKVKDSKNIWGSYEVSNSRFIGNSKRVEDSQYVYNSNQVKNSQYIFSSVDVKNSSNLLLSRSVSNSNKVLNSELVKFSEQIQLSEDINWSKNIIYSKHINESSFIYKGEDVLNCHFCGFGTKITNCLFCIGIEGSSFKIFNKPIVSKDFYKIQEELTFMLQQENSQFITIDHTKIDMGRFIQKYRLDDIFIGLSSNFYGWISTLPNYDEEVFLSLFFKDK